MSDTGIPVDKRICNTVTLTLAELLNNFVKVMPDMKQVYDENLSYLSTVTKLRGDNQQANVRVDMLPCFSFRRSVLRYTEPPGPGKRAIVFTANRKIPSSADPSVPKLAENFHTVQGDFDVEFLYITRSIERLEEFELTYLSEDGISQFKQFPVDLTPDLGGIFNYYATFGPLESKVIQLDDGGNYYKMLTGKITIRGFYFLLVGTSPVIKEIQKRIYDFRTRVLLEQETIR